MAGCRMYSIPELARLGLASLLFIPGLVGCNKDNGVDKAKVVVTNEQDKAKENQAALPPAPLDPRLDQPFAEATLSEPPADAPWIQLPPPTTMTGKSVGKLYTEVVNQWGQVRFVAPEGKGLEYKAHLETDMGNIEITLRPDLAPNHVRNFVALARAGYYDGLVFERTAHEDQPDSRLELIEAGCPLGKGELGYGSIGYWLKPEFSKAPHEEGTVGAWLEEHPDTAACKFYITLCPAPTMDEHYTVFGQVTQGLDVAHKILTLPVRTDTPEVDRPVNPVVIRKMTIRTTEVEKPGQS